MKCSECGREAFSLPENRLDDGLGHIYCSQCCVNKSNNEMCPMGCIGPDDAGCRNGPQGVGVIE